MRIALVSDWFHPRPGGIETQLLGLARELVRQGHSPEVITSSPGADQVGPVKLTRVSGVYFPNSSAIVPLGVQRKLRSFLETGGFDVIHIHLSSFTPLSFLALKIATQAKLPTLITMHSVSPGAVLTLRLMRRLGWFDPISTRITIVGAKLAGQLVPFGAEPKESMLPNGADYGFWSSVSTGCGEKSGDLRIVTAMRLEWTKRPLELPYIMKRLRDRGIRARLDIAGSGQMGGWLLRRASRFGVDKDIHMHGWLDDAALRDLYAKADVFLSPSTRESFGIAALEARIAGVPVVARKNTGIDDFIADDDGALCASDEALIDTLEALARDGKRLERLSGERPRFRSFDWPEIVERHLSLYRQATTD